MATVAPWHSIKQLVCHNNTECNTGNNIEREYFRYGTGNRPLCKECARLNLLRR